MRQSSGRLTRAILPIKCGRPRRSAGGRSGDRAAERASVGSAAPTPPPFQNTNRESSAAGRACRPARHISGATSKHKEGGNSSPAAFPTAPVSARGCGRRGSSRRRRCAYPQHNPPIGASVAPVVNLDDLLAKIAVRYADTGSCPLSCIKHYSIRVAPRRHSNRSTARVASVWT